jgi:hypothetical protein
MLFVFCFCAVGVLSAQTGAEIEALLKTSAVTYAQAARFVLRASDAASISNSREAFNYAVERNWLPKDASPNSEARLDAISLLFMRSFNLKGGVFYSLFKNPHYAYRELAGRKAFMGKSGPSMVVSGEQLLFITSRLLSIVEENK